MTQIFYFPAYQALSGSGTPLAGAKLYFFVTGTATPAAVYADAARTTALANPVIADSQGRFPQIFPNANWVYRVRLTDSSDVQQWQQDGEALQLFPRLDSEISAGLVPTSYAATAIDIDVRRYGIVPNDPDAATTNTAALKALLDPTKTGPVGRLIFPPIAGDDTYYFNDMIQVRDGVHLDLMHCTLHFSKTYSATDDTMGFLTFIRDVSIENGSIVVNYDGSAGAGSNPGPIMRIGSRTGYRFGAYGSGIFDKDDLTDNGLPPMGNIVLRNLRLTTNNPPEAVSVAVLLLGGLQNVLVENVVYEGQGSSVGPSCAFYYEFGFATQNGFPSTVQRWSSSHATNLVFRNIVGRNLNLNTANPNDKDGFLVNLVEAYSALLENLQLDGGYGAAQFRPGEAHFYRPWTANAFGVKRGITMRNISGGNLAGIGISLVGAMGTENGYLNDADMIAAGLPPLTIQQKTDLMMFSVDGFSLQAIGAGIKTSGASDIRNGACLGAFNNVFIDGDTPRFTLTNVESYDATDLGIRASDAATINTSRKKTGSVHMCKVVGSTGAGISLNACDGIEVVGCHLGYNLTDDGVSESTQTSGVQASATASNVVCRNNKVTTSGGAVAYGAAGSGDRGNSLENRRGTATYTAGLWAIDGLSADHSTNIGQKSSVTNTVNKYFGKKIWDTSNERMLLALGSADTSGWRLVDGSGTVTPS